MGLRRLGICILVLATVCVSAGCATSRSVGTNIKRAYNGEPVDRQELKQAVASDTRDAQTGLAVLRRKFEAAYAQLKANVQQRWGHNDARVASRTVFVKYTQDYKSRVIADFDHGTLTIETLDEADPQASLKSAITTALLTSSDPATVDLFTDKEVTLEPHRKPYLYGLVHDHHGRPIATSEQAIQFANYLVPRRMQTRTTGEERSGKTAVFVQLSMVKDFEVKGAERYRASVEKYAGLYNVSPSLVFAIIRTESNFNPFAVSGAPAYGLMQLVPTSGGRAAFRRVQGSDQTPTPEYLLDPDHNIELGTAYLSVLGNTEFQAVGNPDSRDYCVIAAYNAGPRNVTRIFATDRSAALDEINGLAPPLLFDKLRSDLPADETRQYVVRVTGYRKQFLSATAAASGVSAPSRALPKSGPAAPSRAPAPALQPNPGS
jgi:peptidoglycan lytic transglycosylase C